MSDEMADRIAVAREKVLTILVAPVDETAAALESPIEVAMFWGIVGQLNVLGAGWRPRELTAFIPVIRQAARSEKRLEDGIGTAPAEVAAAADRPRKEGSVGGVTSHGYVVRILPQHAVSVNGRNYRLDFALMVEAHALGARTVPVKVAIECDGHDFHEKTKAQAQRDKVRDRDLQADGWGVARFTGAEIFASPEEAGFRALEFLHNLLAQRERETTP